MAAQDRGNDGVRTAKSGAQGRRRLPPHERENMILEGATRFFARHGFAANLRDLASELNVSQALIFKYFATKERLVEKVYDRTFLQRWRPEWEYTLTDGGLDLSHKLKRFYQSYLETVDDYIWIRIALLSGLTGNNLTQQYIVNNVGRLMVIIAREIRAATGQDRDGEISMSEMEGVWLLHSTFIYYLIRKHIYKTPVEMDRHIYVRATVDGFLEGILSVGRQEKSVAE